MKCSLSSFPRTMYFRMGNLAIRGLHLMQTGIDSPFAEKMFGMNRLKLQKPSVFSKAHGNVGLWIKQQINVGGRRFGAIPDESERPFKGSPHVGTKKRGRLSLLLRVPRATPTSQVSLVDALFLSSSPNTRQIEATFHESPPHSIHSQLGPVVDRAAANRRRRLR